MSSERGSAGRVSIVMGLAPWLQTNLRPEPCEKLYAADASPSGAGGCVAPITQRPCSPSALSEEKGEHVRLDLERRRTAEQRARWTCSRCTTCDEVQVDDCFRTDFFKNEHINLLELESFISLLRRATREGVQVRRLLVLVDPRVGFWEPSHEDDRAHEKSTSCFENWGFGATLMT